MIRFRAPVRRQGAGFVVDIGDEERALLARLLGELRDLLIGGDATERLELARLFPPAHVDDPEQEAEYQRLMRDELVASRLASIATVLGVLDEPRRIDDEELTAFMQSLNAVRLILGTMLGVTDDPDDVADEDATPEHHLYDYLSWLLEWTVRAASS